jgi:hypothetical protein
MNEDKHFSPENQQPFRGKPIAQIHHHCSGSDGNLQFFHGVSGG